jgi:sigma-E factor negative regulatory protein RseC
MLKETAQIIEAFVESDGSQWAFVEIQRKGMCGTCQAEGACSTHLLADFFAHRAQHRLKLLNTLNAKQGDYITIGLLETTFLKSALLVYFFPILLLFISGMTAQIFFAPLSDLWIGIASLSGFAIGFFITYLVSQQANKNPYYQPIMLESSFNR